MSPTRVLMPLPSHDFDPTETGAPWQVLHDDAPDVEVVFATPDGQQGAADPIMLGRGAVRLGLFEPFLIADANGRAAYDQMAVSPAFQHPISYAAINPDEFDGLVLPGGHAPGVKVYLESPVLQARVAPFFAARKPIGAICHGVVLASRCQGNNGRSVLDGYRTTALTREMELFAWNLTRHLVGNYYRTYSDETVPPGTTVEEEVTAAAGQFDPGPRLPAALIPRPGVLIHPGDHLSTAMFSNLLKTGFFRDQRDFEEPAHTVCHGDHFVSARWPGDAFTFAKRFLALLRGRRC